MVRHVVVASTIGALTLLASCSLVVDLDGLQSSEDGGATKDTSTVSDTSADVVTVGDSANIHDSGSDAPTCSCTDMISTYRFTDQNALGVDFFGKNTMTDVTGTPSQSATTPNGLPGYSLELDGGSGMCIDRSFTFNSAADHTLCWWAQPTALSNQTDQFAQKCGYDTWTTNNGADYLWHINNCNTGTAADLQVPNLYSVGRWVEICQTYEAASFTRTVIVNGDPSQKYTVTDTVPLVESSGSSWCIGSYGSGGFWTGLIYRPIWFDRVLSDTEIQQVYANPCCLP